MAPSGESFRNTFFLLHMVQSFYRRYLQNTTNNVTGAQEDHDMRPIRLSNADEGGCQIFRKKRYEGVRFNVISITMGWVGVQFSGKKALRNT